MGLEKTLVFALFVLAWVPPARADDITFSVVSGAYSCTSSGACACPTPVATSCTAGVCTATLGGLAECMSGDVNVNANIILQPVAWVPGDGSSSTNGTLTIRANGDSGTVTINSGAVVQADGRGFAGSLGAASGSTSLCPYGEGVLGNGNGPGYGSGGRCHLDAGGGGGYGGAGGRGVADGNCSSAADGIGGLPYDTEPNGIERGSAGGAAGSRDGDSGGTGPAGGGAITISGRNVIISGTVRSRGSSGSIINGDSMGGGSGGGVLLVAAGTLTCNSGNALDVQGGNGAVGDDRGGAGGGGRIKIITASAISGSCNYNVAAGTSGCTAGAGGTGLIGGALAAPTLTAPVDNSATSVRRPTVTGTVTADTCLSPTPTIDIYDNGIRLVAAVAVTCPAPLGSAAGSFSFTPTADLAEGSHTFRAYVMKTISTVPFTSAASNSRRVYIDVSDPVVSVPAFSAPSGTAQTAGSVTDASPTTVVVTYCSLSSGQTCATMGTCAVTHSSSALTASPNFSYNPSTTDVPDGRYCVRTVATDSVSRSTTALNDLVLDRTSPTVSVDNGLGVRTTPRTVCANISDASSLTVSASWTLSSVSQGALTVVAGACTMSGGGTGTHTVTLPAGGNGPAVVTFSAVDGAGNVASSNGSLILDNTAPALTLSAFSPNPATSANASGTLTDTNASLVVLDFCSLSPGQTCLDLVACSSALTTSPISPSGGLFSYTGVAPIDGTYCVVATATDAAGNTSTAQQSLVLDRVAPTMSADAVPTTRSPRTICVALSDALTAVSLQASLSIDSAAQPAPTVTAESCTLAAGGSGNYTVAIQGGDGSASLVLTGRDGANNQTQVTRLFTIDNTVPAVTISTPATALQSSAATSGSVVDATLVDVVVQHCSMSVGETCPLTGACVVAATQTFNAGNTFSTSPALSDGDYCIVVTATDAANNASSSSRSLTLDQTPPLIAADTGTFRGSPFKYCMSVTDDHLASVSVTMSVNGATPVPLSVVPDTCLIDGVAAGTHSVEVPPNTNGSVVLLITGTDALLQQSTLSRTVTVVPSGPLVSLFSESSPSSAERPRVFGEVSDPDGLQLVTLSTRARSGGVCGALLHTETLAGGTFSVEPWPAGVVPDGEYCITLEATDLLGNVSRLDIVLEKLSTAPRLSVSVAPNPTTDSTPLVNGSASSGIASVVVSVRRLDEFSTCAGSVIDSGLVNPSQGAFSFTPTAPVTHMSACEVFCVVAEDQGSAVVAETRFEHCQVGNDDIEPLSIVFSPRSAGAAVAFSGTAPANATSARVLITSKDAGGHCTESVLHDVTVATVNGTPDTYAGTTSSPMQEGSYCVTVVALNGTAELVRRSDPLDVLADTTPPDVSLDVFVPNPSTSADAAGTATDLLPVTVVLEYCALSIGETCADLAVCSANLTSPSLSPVAGQYSYSGASPVDGTYCVVATATDAANNSASAQRDLVLDTTPPTVTLAPPGSVSTPRTICVRVDDSLTSVTLGASWTVGGIAATSPVVTAQSCSMAGAGTGNFTVDLSAGTPDGAAVLTLVGTDAAGNEAVETVNFVIDNSLPSIAVVTPTVALQRTSAATGTASDESGVDISVAYCSLAVGDSCPPAGACAVAALAAFPAATTFSTQPTLADGSYCIVATATDGAGQTASASQALELDQTPPTVLTDSNANRGSPFVFCLSVADAHPGSVSATMSVNSGAAIPLVVTPSACLVDGSTAGTHSALIPPNLEGSVVLVVTATDGAGNVTTQPSTLSVDVSGPIVSLFAESSPSGAERPRVFGAVSDADGLSSATLTTRSRINGVCGAVIHTEVVESGSFSVEPWPDGVLPDGEYCVQLVAVDTLSNRSTLEVVQVKVSALPRISLDVSPSPTSDSTPTVSGSASNEVALVVVSIREIDLFNACAGAVIESGTVVPSQGAFSFTPTSELAHSEACRSYCVLADDQGSDVVAETRFVHCLHASDDISPMSIGFSPRSEGAPVGFNGTAPSNATSVRVLITAKDSLGHCTETAVSDVTVGVTPGSPATFSGTTPGSLPLGAYCATVVAIGNTGTLVRVQTELVVEPQAGGSTGGSTGASTGAGNGGSTATSSGSSNGGDTSGSSNGGQSGGGEATGGASTGSTFSLDPSRSKIAGTGCQSTGSDVVWLLMAVLWGLSRRRFFR